MYVPHFFDNPRIEDLHRLIDDHPFGLLVTGLNGRPEATHVPFLLDRGAGPKGALRFHLAGANPSAGVVAGSEALVVFSGPHAYVSPDWYGAPGHVPTWNYTAVHAYGRPRALDDAELEVLLADLSAASEKNVPKTPWTPDKLSPDAYGKMRRAIAGFCMPVDTLQGKWKLGQNRRPDERAGAIDNLRATGGPDAVAVADLMTAIDD